LRVAGKAQNYRLWQGGFYGNKLRAWRTLPDLYNSDYRGNTTIRYLGDVGGQWCRYDVPFDLVGPATHELMCDGADIDRIMYNEALPDESLVLQGELWTGADAWLWMRYSTVCKKMRDALAETTQFSSGLKSLNLLKSHMSPSSFSDLEVLIERYRDHAIEFSVCSCPFGNTAGRNAVVWEVRSY
jgi:hypothetical protein